MDDARPTLAGRPLPHWAGIAIRLCVFFLLGGVSWQATQLQAETAAQETAVAPISTAETPTSQAAALAASAADPFAGLRRLAVGRQLRHGEYVWNEEGAAPGRLSILVDLSAQTLSVFRSGREIGRAVILYGTEEDPTPTGTFPITEKDIDHESNLYEAMMPYMLRLTNDGIAIHGSEVRYGWASRGCIGVPMEFAERLFGEARLGDVVTIVPGDPSSAGPPYSPAPWEPGA